MPFPSSHRLNPAGWIILVVVLSVTLILFLSSCASTPVVETTVCGVARAEVLKCGDSTSDSCLYYRLLLSYCDRGDQGQVSTVNSTDPCHLNGNLPQCQGLIASASSYAPPTPGSGYTPTSTYSSYRLIPGGPELHGLGSLSPSFDPWAINCAGKSGGESAACLRSRYLSGTPEICDAYMKAFGVPTCGSPGGGWTRGPSNERWGSAKSALDYFCLNDPTFIGSAGRAGGWDCESTALDWARLGAFGGEYVVTEWQKRASDGGGGVPVPTACIAPKQCLDPPTPCPDPPTPLPCDSCCPDPLPCSPSPTITLTPRTLGELKMVCSQIPSSRPQQRLRCKEAIQELGHKLGFDVSALKDRDGGSVIDPIGRSVQARDGGSIIDPVGKTLRGPLTPVN